MITVPLTVSPYCSYSDAVYLERKAVSCGFFLFVNLRRDATYSLSQSFF